MVHLNLLKVTQEIVLTLKKSLYQSHLVLAKEMAFSGLFSRFFFFFFLILVSNDVMLTPWVKRIALSAWLSLLLLGRTQ